MDPFKLILQADIIVKGVILLLVFLSVYSWAIIVQKILLFRKIQENIEKYATFFQGQSNIEAVLQKSQNATLNPMASMLVYAYQAFQKSLKDNQNQNKKEEFLTALEKLNLKIKIKVLGEK